MTLYSARRLDLKTYKESQESETFLETYGFKFPAERRECVRFNEAQGLFCFCLRLLAAPLVPGRWRCPEPDLWDLALCHVQTG